MRGAFVFSASPFRPVRHRLGFPRGAARRREFARLAGALRAELERHHFALVDFLRCGPRRLLATFRAALADRIEEKLPGVAVPALVVRGDRDPIVPERWAVEVARLLARGRLITLPGVAHAAHYAAPAAFARVAGPFLAAGRPEPRAAAGRA